MKIIDIKLSEQYPFLAGNSDAVVTAYLQEDIVHPAYMDDFRRPALLICPGGSYQWCTPREAEPIAMAFAPMGFNCFILRYSVIPHTWPTPLRELAAAVDLLHKNADAWNLDPDKIVLSGFSAGGHLAAAYCTRRDLPEIRSVIEARPVRAALLGYPAISILKKDPDVDMTAVCKLLGIDELTDEQIEKFAFERHVSKELTPPTFLWHTAADEVVPVDNSLRYASALAEKEIPFELHIFPYGRHGLATSDRQTNRDHHASDHLHVHQWIPLAQSWLEQTLGL